MWYKGYWEFFSNVNDFLRTRRKWSEIGVQFEEELVVSPVSGWLLTVI